MDFSPLPIEDGFSADRLFSQGYSYTYDDVIFLPHYIDFPTDAVSLSTRLTRNIDLSLPCVASPMDTVTEDYMAAAMAALGGIGIVHSNCTAADQARLVVSAKSRRVLIFSSSLDVFKAPDGCINDANDFDGSNYVFVTESGTRRSRILGYVTKSDWENLSDNKVKIFDYMRDCSSNVSVPANYDLGQIDEVLEKNDVDFVVLEKDGERLDVVTREDVERLKGYPNLGKGTVGPDGKWMVGAAIGTRESDKERLEHLVKAGVNVVVLDSSQGNSSFQIEMIKYAKKTYPELDVIGGNVVTMYQAQNLIEICLRLWFDVKESGGRRKNEHDQLLLEALQPPLNLKELFIGSYGGNTVSPSWMMSLTNLRSLNLHLCENCEQLPPLGKLSSLEKLYISDMKSVKRVGNEILGIESDHHDSSSSSSVIIAFPKLQSLFIEDLPELEEWDYGITRTGHPFIDIMPRLSSLAIAVCPKLKALPDHIHQTTALKGLSIWGCDLLEERYRKGEGEDWPKISHIPNIYINYLRI